MTRADIDWTDDEVRDFVSDQINYYGFEVTPEESKQGISPWKLWLWLEKHGFDFAYRSIESEIFAFRIDHERAGVPLVSERNLLLLIRAAMRNTLGLPALDSEATAHVLAVVPISNWSHWASVRGPYRDGPNITADYSDVVDFAWSYLEDDKPEYIPILKDVIRHNEDHGEEFIDNFTFNGSYNLSLPTLQRRYLFSMITDYHIKKSYDMFLAPGNLALHDHVTGRFLDSILSRLQ